jgi:precorrin-4/cobalt-precorrin-4 C11-methyltransferase
MPAYGADCPAIVVFRASWPDEQVISGTLADIETKLRETDIARTALIFVGRVFGADGFTDSRLYHIDHRHVHRPK